MTTTARLAFLIASPVVAPSSRFPSTKRCAVKRHGVFASASQHKSPPPEPILQSLAKATFIAMTASLLAFSNPAVQDPSASNLIAPAEAARGGGASFTSASGEVIKDPEALLRWSLPIKNKTVRTLQRELESTVNDLRGLKWSSVDGHARKAAFVLNNQTEKILSDVPKAKRSEASKLLSRVADGISSVENAISEKNGDQVTNLCRKLLRNVGDVEQMMVTKFPFKVPDEFSNLPQLRGRATVEMQVRKGGDEQFDINGSFFKDGKLTLVLDGYSAPISAGNFIDLVNKGFYNDIDVLRSDGFIVQAGKPRDGDGYIDKSTGKMRTIPLEVFAKGDNEPTYGITLEDDGRGAESTVLPFTSYGTLAVARVESEADSASSQFFWFLFEPDLTPAGRNLMDGNWAVMGYTTEGGNFLRELRKGDQIVSAKVVDGLQNLVEGSSTDVA